MFILATTFDCTSLKQVIGIAGFALKAIQYVAPVLLILWGSIDLIKSIIQGKEEDIKKSQKVLIKRIISAVLLFLLPMLVSILLGLIGAKEWKNCWNKHKNSGISVDVDKQNL